METGQIRKIHKYVAVGGALMLGLVLVSGCHTSSPDKGYSEVPGVPRTTGTAPTPTSRVPATNPTVSPAIKAALTNAYETLRVGDGLLIIFSDIPNPIAPFDLRVGEDGKVTLPYNQTFDVSGKTVGELEKEVRERYVPRIFVNLTVTIKPYPRGDRFYYVEGEVRAPSKQQYVERITVRKAIASAGGFTDFAKKTKVRVTHRDGRSQVINCIKAIEHPELDVEVLPDDTIHVPRKLW